jgi:hypothetical protein
MFVRTPFCLRHQHSILSQGHRLIFPLTNRFLVFEITVSRLSCRAAPVRNTGHLKRIWQSLTNQVNLVSTFDTTAGCCALAVELHVPSRDRCCRQASGLEKSAIEKPAIDTQRISRRRHNVQTTWPAACAVAHAHWKLKPPNCPVTSTTSPIKYKPACCLLSMVFEDSASVSTPPIVTSAVR